MTDSGQSSSQPPVCYRHPDRPTRLSCSECGKPICGDCSHESSVGQRCAECAKPVGRNRIIDARRTTGAMAGLTSAPATKTILAVTVAVFVVGLLPDAQDWLLTNLSTWNFRIADGEWWRLISGALLHSYGSFILIHIGFNMYFLYQLGPPLERQVGSVPFTALYLATAATGGVASFYLGELGTAALGASGAIFGLVAVWLYAAYRSGNPMARTMANQNLTWLVGIGIVLPFLASGLGISWQGHLGGMVGGVLIGWLWSLFAARADNPKQIRTAIALAVLAACILAVLLIAPPYTTF